MVLLATIFDPVLLKVIVIGFGWISISIELITMPWSMVFSLLQNNIKPYDLLLIDRLFLLPDYAIYHNQYMDDWISVYTSII